jgi:hypothetical protein
VNFYEWLLAHRHDFGAQAAYALGHKDDFPQEPKTREELFAYLKAKRDCDVEVGKGFVHVLGLYTSQSSSERGPDVKVSFDFSGAPDDEKKPPR